MPALGRAMGDSHSTSWLPCLDNHNSHLSCYDCMHTAVCIPCLARRVCGEEVSCVQYEASWVVEDLEAQYSADTVQGIGCLRSRDAGRARSRPGATSTLGERYRASVRRSQPVAYSAKRVSFFEGARNLFQPELTGGMMATSSLSCITKPDSNPSSLLALLGIST